MGNKKSKNDVENEGLSHHLIQPTPPKQKKYHWKFFVGFLVGFVLTLGAILGFGLWVYNNMTFAKIENLAGFKIEVLGDDVKNMTFTEIVGTVTDVANNYEQYTFEELVDVVGMLDVSSFLTVTGEGETKTYAYKKIDVTPVVKGKIGEIKANLQKVVDKTTLAQVESSLSLSLPDMIFIRSIKEKPLSQLGTAISDLKETYTLEDMSLDFEMSLEGTILENLKDKTLGELPTEIDTMTIEEVVGTAAIEGNTILEAVRNIEIGKIADDLPGLTLNKILGETNPDNLILKAIGGTTLTNLNSTIQNLSFKQIFPAPESGEDTRHPVIKKLADQDIKLTDVDTRMGDIINDLTVEEIFGEQTSGVWHLIGGDVKVSQLEARINVVFRNTSIGVLVEEGVLETTYTIDQLESKSVTVGGNTKSLAECTLVEIINFIME